MKYNAFVSYSHAADGKLAPALQDGLHRFAKSWTQLRALHIFRDDASLSANPGLWSSIEQALTESEFFIFLASPEAAQSVWTTKELDWWCKHKPVSKLLIVQTGGFICWNQSSSDFDWTQTNALPRRLEGVFKEEPRFVDLGWARTREHISLTDPRFLQCIADIAAPLHHRPKDELIGEDVRLHRRAMRTRRIGFAAISLLALIAIVFAFTAIHQKNETQRNESVFLAELSSQQMDSGSSMTAIRLAIKGLPEPHVFPSRISGLWQKMWQRPYIPESEAALARAMYEGRELVRFSGHQSNVLSTAFNSDGTKVITGSADRTARIWEVSSGKQLIELRGHDSEIIQAEFNPDDTKVVTVGILDPPRLWDAHSGKLIAVLRSRSNGFVTFSPEGQTIEISHRFTNRLMSVFDAKSGTQLLDVPLQEPLTKDTLVQEYSLDGQQFLSQSPDGRLTISFPRSEALPIELHGHQGKINYAQFSLDGRVLVTASKADQTTRVWSAETGVLISTLQGHNGHVNYAAFSSDGTKLVTRSPLDQDSGYQAEVWQIHSGEKISVLTHQYTQFWFDFAYFSPDGNRIATVELDVNFSMLWDVQTGEEIRPDDRLESEGTPTGMSFGNAIGFSADSNIFVSAPANSAALWSAASGELMALLIGHTGGINSLDFSPGNDLIVTGSNDGTARLWDITAPRPAATIDAHTARLTAALFSPDGAYILTASYDDTVHIWSTNPKIHLTGSIVCKGGWADDYSSMIKSAEFSLDGTTIMSACSDGTVHILNRNTGEQSSFTSKQNDIESAAFSQDGAKVIILSRNSWAEVWDVGTRKRLSAVNAEQQATTLRLLITSNDGAKLLAVYDDGTARLWNTLNQTEITVFASNSARKDISTAQFSPDGLKIVTLSGDGVPQLWDADTGRVLTMFQGEKSDLHDANYRDYAYLQFSPDATKLVTASEKGVVQLWDVGNGRKIASLRSDTYLWESPVDRSRPIITFSSDGTRIVTTSFDNQPTVWDSNTGERLGTLMGHNSDVRLVSFSPDGTKLITLARSTMRLWDVYTSQVLATFHGHEFAVSYAAFSLDGKRLVAGSDDGTFRIWRLLPHGESLIDEAHKRVKGQPFTREEQEQFRLRPQ